MRIALDDPGNSRDVLVFLRERGCIAHALDASTLEVCRPRSLARYESRDVLAMLEECQEWRPRIGFRVVH